MWVLTRYPSEVNGLFGPRRAAVFGTEALVAGCIHAELENVVLLHHWRRRAEQTALQQEATQRHVQLFVHSPVIVCQCPLHRDSLEENEVENWPLPLFTEAVTYTHTHRFQVGFILTETLLLLMKARNSHLPLTQDQSKVLVRWFPSMQQQPRVRDGSNFQLNLKIPTQNQRLICRKRSRADSEKRDPNTERKKTSKEDHLPIARCPPRPEKYAPAWSGFSKQGTAPWL